MSIGLWAQVAVLFMDCDVGLLGQIIYRLDTGYVLRVELPVQRRLCQIFVRDVKSPGIHKRFHGLTGSQRTPEIWGVTAWYQSQGIRIPRELGFGYPSPLGWFDV